MSAACKAHSGKHPYIVIDAEKQKGFMALGLGENKDSGMMICKTSTTQKRPSLL